MTGMKRNLKEILEIAQSTSDPKTKLQARAIAVDCYKYIMEMTTDGIIVTDAMKFVQTNKEKLMMSKEGEKESNEPDYGEDRGHLEEQEEETGELNRETMNNVF